MKSSLQKLQFLLFTLRNGNFHLPQKKTVQKMKRVGTILSLVLLVGLVPNITSANPLTDFFSCGFNLATCSIYIATYTASTILGLLLSIGAFFLVLALEFSLTVVNSPIVQTGFSASLAITNLGFVLAIIIIAIATILRSQNYGMKQTLAKLIIAAILVNFGLVIAGIIVNFSNQIALFFAHQVSPVAGGKSGFMEFVTKMVGAFKPQNALDTKSIPAAIAINSGLETFFKALMNLVFNIVFLSMATITIFALAIMSMVRYVYLGILLIIMPFVWLFWVFGNTKQHWNKWWDKFLKWSFFAPISLFFMYLAIYTVQVGGAANQQAITAASANGGPASTILAILGLQSDIMQTAANMILLSGLLFGSIFAANSFGIAGASAAKGMVEKGFNNARGAASRYTRLKAKAGVSNVMNSRPARALESRLQSTQLGSLDRAKTPLGKFGRAISSAPAIGYAGRYLGRGLEAARVQGGESVVGDEKKNLPSGPNTQLANIINTGTAREPQVLAILEKLMKDGDLSYVKDVDKFITADREAVFNKYGQQKLWKDMNIARESTPEIRERAKKLGNERERVEADTLVVDREGILGSAGAEVRFGELKKKALDEPGRLRQSATAKRKAGDMEGADFEENLARKQELGLKNAKNQILAKNEEVLAKLREIKEIDKNGILGEVGKEVSSLEIANKLSADFHATLQKKDVALMHLNEQFGAGKAQFGMTDEQLRTQSDIITHGVSIAAPQLASTMMGRMKSDQLQGFQTIYKQALEFELRKYPDENSNEHKHYKDLLNKLENSIGNNITFEGGQVPRADTPPGGTIT